MKILILLLLSLNAKALPVWQDLTGSYRIVKNSTIQTKPSNFCIAGHFWKPLGKFTTLKDKSLTAQSIDFFNIEYESAKICKNLGDEQLAEFIVFNELGDFKVNGERRMYSFNGQVQYRDPGSVYSVTWTFHERILIEHILGKIYRLSATLHDQDEMGYTIDYLIERQ